MAYVGRLDQQKGMHLVHHALFYILAQGGQFGIGDANHHDGISGHFWHLRHYLSGNPDCPGNRLAGGAGSFGFTPAPIW